MGSRSRTVNPPQGDLVLSVVFTCDSPYFDIPCVKFDNRLTFEDHVLGIVSRVSQRIGFEVGEACLCGHLCGASLLQCICSPNP